MSELSIKSYLDKDVKQKWNRNFYENEGYIEEKLIVQYESLYKINAEMESVMFSPTNKTKFAVNLITLNEFIQKTENVICLDAYVSNRTINYLDNLEQEPYVIYNNYKAEWTTPTILQKVMTSFTRKSKKN